MLEAEGIAWWSIAPFRSKMSCIEYKVARLNGEVKAFRTVNVSSHGMRYGWRVGEGVDRRLHFACDARLSDEVSKRTRSLGGDR